MVTLTNLAPADVTPMQFEWVELADMERFVTDDRWVAEQKLDGMRVMARIDDGRVSFVGSGGTPVEHAASLLVLPPVRECLEEAFPQGQFVLDGELLLDGTYNVFDMPLASMGGEAYATPADTYADRSETLEAVYSAMVWPQWKDEQPPVRLLRTYVGTEAKRAFVAQAEAAGVEGVMFKRLTGDYACGKRVKSVLKAKFVKTADCVVVARDTGGTKNAKLAMFEGEHLRLVGGCSMIGKPDAQPGDVVECKYLYATEALILYQPSMLKIRTDKRPEDCLISQLVPTNKSVL